MNCFDDVLSIVAHLVKPVRVAVVCPDDESTRLVMQRVEAEGWGEFLTFGGNPTEAAAEAVCAVRSGSADVLMKGLLSTSTLLKAILDKEHGLLPTGGTLSHICMSELPMLDRMLFFSDVAVIPRPTLEQFDAILRNDIGVCRKMLCRSPKVAMIHCNEAVSDKFPVTLDYQKVKLLAAEGRYGDVNVDGPMDVKTACDAKSAAVKGIESAVAGCADLLIFPDIEAGNAFYKTITMFPGVRTACMLTGTTAPVVLPSRADSAEAKYYSLSFVAMNVNRCELMSRQVDEVR